jgi:hypothetical protein
LLSSRVPPQLLFAAQPFVERYGLQLVHGPRPRLHHSVPMPQQLPQIAILPTRDPDLGKAIFQQQAQNQLRVLAIRLLLPHSLRADLGRIPNPQLKLQLSQQPFKPTSVPTRFHPYTHFEFLRSQIAIELFRVLAMLQPPFLQLTRVCIDKRNLLEARMVIRSYNDHRSAPFSRASVGSHHQSLLGCRSRHCYGINCTHLQG